MSDTMHDWFAATVRRHPGEPALLVDDATFTYRELAALVDSLAADLGPMPTGARVGLLAARSPLAYAGYLAILRGGGTVVPLNPIFPPDRNATIAARAGLWTVLLDTTMAASLAPVSAPLVQATPGGRVVGRGRRRDAAVDPPEPTGEAPAYILFTSGSTGVPKGLPIRHDNVRPYVEHHVARYDVGPGSRLSQTFDLTFDPSVFDMFVTWTGGGALVVPRREELADPAAFVNRHGITHWFSVPSVVSLAGRMRRLPAGRMPDLRWGLFAGEQLTADQAVAWHRAAPDAVIENLYGPTELTVTCTGYRLPADPAEWPRTRNGTVPIGRCLPHLEYVVLDEQGHPAHEGELCVRGPQRFAGYLDPANNADRFVSWSPGRAATTHPGSEPLTEDLWYRTGDRVVDDGGELTHLGRLDAQVQVHGYRVELGEIEAVLRRHPEVEDAAVFFDGVDLRALYVGGALPAEHLARWVAARLPGYMVPARIASVELFPRNDNGKLDRRKLEALAC
ncbi:amino acid adenylation domain-containing protein [Micromonospora sp. NPDC049175]|uniref:amino acid adenylation domain-containing protein n=1 Tax=Micromonospora sp. NPDC049175 TaxID=3364266 RepID=UPI0037154849